MQRYELCFANRNGKCLILRQEKCSGQKDCKFYKTKDDLEIEVQLCKERLEDIGYLKLK